MRWGLASRKVLNPPPPRPRLFAYLSASSHPISHPLMNGPTYCANVLPLNVAQVVPDPLEFEVVCQRLKSKEYYLTEAIFRADMERIFANWQTYFVDRTEVTQRVEQLKRYEMSHQVEQLKKIFLDLLIDDSEIEQMDDMCGPVYATSGHHGAGGGYPNDALDDTVPDVGYSGDQVSNMWDVDCMDLPDSLQDEQPLQSLSIGEGYELGLGEHGGY